MCQYVDKLSNYLAEMGSAMGKHITLDESNRCFLSSENGIDVMISGVAGSDIFNIVSYLCPLPQNNREPLLSHALSLNLFQQETRGAAIAINTEINALVLCYTQSIEETAFQDFINIVSNMAQLSEQLSGQLATFVQNQSVGASQAVSGLTEESGMMMRI